MREKIWLTSLVVRLLALRRLSIVASRGSSPEVSPGLNKPPAALATSVSSVTLTSLLRADRHVRLEVCV